MLPLLSLRVVISGSIVLRMRPETPSPVCYKRVHVDSKIKYTEFYNTCVPMFMYYTVCYFTGIFYAVVRQISMLFRDNKDSVFCKSTFRQQQERWFSRRKQQQQQTNKQTKTSKTNKQTNNNKTTKRTKNKQNNSNSKIGKFHLYKLIGRPRNSALFQAAFPQKVQAEFPTEKTQVEKRVYTIQNKIVSVLLHTTEVPPPPPFRTVSVPDEEL